MSLPNFSLSTSSGISIYTLNTNFTINDDWTEFSLTTGNIIIDGNGKTITIANLNTTSLFYGGGPNSGKISEIKNLTIIANTDITGIVRAYNYLKINNCHLEVNGNINNNGGGLVFNDNYDYGTADIQMINSSIVVFGKIGDNSGPLFGYFSLGCSAIISNSFSIVLDDNSLNGLTLGSAAGAFVGSGVGSSGQNVSITNSYCIFNGSMGAGSGIIAGKFLGSSGEVVLNNFYAITNITYAIASTEPQNIGQYSFFLSSYFGGSLFNNITATNVNLLNFNINDINMYASTSTVYSTVSGINKYTTFNSFNSAINSPVGDITFYLNYKADDDTISSYKCYSPTDNIKYEILMGTNNKLLLNRTLTIDGPLIKRETDPNFNLIVTIEPVDTVNYSSSDTNIAAVNSSGVVDIISPGIVTLTAYSLCDEIYSYSEVSYILTIETIITNNELNINKITINNIDNGTISEIELDLFNKKFNKLNIKYNNTSYINLIRDIHRNEISKLTN
jgi:hypothetical protein